MPRWKRAGGERKPPFHLDRRNRSEPVPRSLIGWPAALTSSRANERDGNGLGPGRRDRDAIGGTR